MKQITITAFALALAATCSAGDMKGVVPPMPSALVVPSSPIDSPEQLDILAAVLDCSEVDPVQGCRQPFIHTEIVTGGIKLNWIGEPHWIAVDPEPDRYLRYMVRYHSYCRIGRPILDGFKWRREAECISERAGAIFYQRFDYHDRVWGRRIIVFSVVSP